MTIGMTVAMAPSSDAGLSEVNWGVIPGGLVSKAVNVAMSYRNALYYSISGKPFNGPEAARMGLINVSVPDNQLRDEVMTLARQLAALNPEAVRATKQAIRHVRTMDVPQAYEYLASKGQAIKVGDNEDSYNTGLRQFLDEKSYKPTFEPFKLGTMLTDQRANGRPKK